MAYDNNVNAKNASGGAPLYKSNNIKEVMNTSAPICISSYIKGNQAGNRPMTKGASRRQASFNNTNGSAGNNQFNNQSNLRRGTTTGSQGVN